MTDSTTSLNLSPTWSPDVATSSAVNLPRERYPRQLVARLWRQPAPLLGACLVLLYIGLACFGHWVAPYEFTEQHLTATLQPPSWTYWFGTDQFGRDILSRVVMGSRSIILLSVTSTTLALLVGVVIGLLAGYVGGKMDELLMRTMDILLAFPALLLALLVISMLGSNLMNLILTLALLFTPAIARVARSVVLDLRTHEFVTAAYAVGATTPRILLRHILPNSTGPLVVEGALCIGYAALAGGAMGFLGLGVQPPSPDWGLQVSDGRNFLLTAPWVVLFPALAISSLVIGVNLMADGLERTVEQ